MTYRKDINREKARFDYTASDDRTTRANVSAKQQIMFETWKYDVFYCVSFESYSCFYSKVFFVFSSLKSWREAFYDIESFQNMEYSSAY